MNQFKGAKIAYVVFALVIFSLVVNIVYLGITGKHLISGSDIKTYAKNRGKSESIEYATRGSIYTSDNEVIAKSVRNFKLSAVVSKKREGKNAYVKDIKKTAQEVAPIIGMDPNEMEQKMQEAVDAGKYQIEFGTYGNNLTMGQKTEIEKKDLPGLVFEEVNTRNYPLGDFSSYIVGYAKNTTDEDGVKKLVGEMGIERNYDEVLAGKNGYRVYEKTADGYVRTNGILKKKDAVNGKDIYLTLNSSLQRDLDYLLAKEAGEAGASNASCVVMEAKTGKILALSTYPSFDPNKRDIIISFLIQHMNVDQYLNHLFMQAQLKVDCIMEVHFINLVNMIMELVDQLEIIIMVLVGVLLAMMKDFIVQVMWRFVTY